MLSPSSLLILCLNVGGGEHGQIWLRVDTDDAYMYSVQVHGT